MPSAIFLSDLNYTCANGQEPDFRNILGVTGSDNTHSPAYQGALYVHDLQGFLSGVVCAQTVSQESTADNGGTYSVVWTSSNGPARMQDDFDFDIDMFWSDNVNCASGSCLGGYVFTINTCVAYHFSGDSEADQSIGVNHDWQLVKTASGDFTAVVYSSSAPVCPEPPVTCSMPGDNTCQFVADGGFQSYTYMSEYLAYDGDGSDGGCSNDDPALPDCEYFDQQHLFDDGHCDTDPATARWEIIESTGDGPVTGGHFLCPDTAGDGSCYNTDLNDCCNAPSVGPACGSYVPSGAGFVIRLPLLSSEWLALMRNTSVQSIGIPRPVAAQLAGIAMSIIEPVSASSAGYSYIGTDAGKLCYKTSVGIEASSCNTIVEAGACASSYKRVVGNAVVSPCEFANGACARSSRPYRACPASVV